jgi:hypothetical protein
MKAVLAAGLALLVSGCVSTPPKQTTSQFTTGRNEPVALSDADRAAVETGVRAALNGAGNPAFRTMIATKDEDGVVTLCGYVNAGPGDKPYVGVLTSAGFSVTGMGGSDADTIATHAACSHKGVHI